MTRTSDDSNLPSRRSLLAGAAAAGLAGGIATPPVAAMARAAARLTDVGGSPTSDYRAVVVVEFAGGTDAHAVLAPRSGTAHSEYAAARGILTIPQSRLQPLPLSTTGGSVEIGLNDRFQRMKALYDAGDVAIVPNVGALIEPTDRDGARGGSRRIPKNLFAHNTLQGYWQQGRPEGTQGVGWAGLGGDRIAALNNGTFPVNISLGGIRRLQVGENEVPFTIQSSGVSNYSAFNGGQGAGRRGAYLDVLDVGSHSNVFVREYARIQQRAIDQNAQIEQALASAPPLSTVFPAPIVGGNLPQQLEMVARLMSIRQTLGVCRQVFYVRIGGWDTHNDPQLTGVEDRFSEVDAALGAFYDALGELQLRDRVTTMTISEFGRTLTSNGRGSDHGWGGHYMVMGGAVQGGRTYGEYPDLTREGPRDMGAGRLVPTTSFSQYTATALKWLGVPDTDLPAIYPFLDNFPNRVLGYL